VLRYSSEDGTASTASSSITESRWGFCSSFLFFSFPFLSFPFLSFPFFSFLFLFATNTFAYLTNKPLWFWCGCAGCATSAPNLLDPRNLFRHVNPAPTKSNPKPSAHTMRGQQKVLKYYLQPLPIDSHLGSLNCISTGHQAI
jgi:hypothetical protein